MRRYRQTAGFTLLELMVTVAIIGVLAAVAIPSFMTYIRRARAAEAPQMLEKIYSGARTYYLEGNHYRDARGAMVTVPSQFPASEAITPAVPCCSAGLNRCPATPASWETPTWQSIQFSLSDPHYYRYAFESSDVGGGSEFFAYAYGDLDCDGELSTYAIYGDINANGEVSGTQTLSRVNPLE